MAIRIGFVGTRFAGADSVSLESATWAEVLWDRRHVSYWYGGKLDRHPDVSLHAPHAHSAHPDIAWIHDHVFGERTRSPELTRRIYAISDYLKGTLYEFTRKFDIDLLIAENCLALPANIPLGLAVTHFIAETGFPAIAHHHEFYWERDRFAANAVGDLLATAFPPSLPAIQHVTTNAYAQSELSRRRGMSSLLVPQVMDFEQSPPASGPTRFEFRNDLELGPDDIVFLQPAQHLSGADIAHSIALISGLNHPNHKLVVAHELTEPRQGHDCLVALRAMAAHEHVDLRCVGMQGGEIRTTRAERDGIYTLANACSQADFILSPGVHEKLGGTLLGALYHRKPVLIHRDSWGAAELEPHGARVVTFRGEITSDIVAQVRRVLDDERYRTEMAHHNFELGKAFYSYSVLRRKLTTLIANVTGAEG